MIPKSKQLYDHFNNLLKTGQYVENLRHEGTYGQIMAIHASVDKDYHLITYCNAARNVFENCDNSNMLRILNDEEVMLIKLAGKI